MDSCPENRRGEAALSIQIWPGRRVQKQSDVDARYRARATLLLALTKGVIFRFWAVMSFIKT